MTAKSCRRWMKTQGTDHPLGSYYDRWILPVKNLNAGTCSERCFVVETLKEHNCAALNKKSTHPGLMNPYPRGAWIALIESIWANQEAPSQNFKGVMKRLKTYLKEMS